MAIYSGEGRLVGVHSYTKDNQTKVVYVVAEGDPDPQTKLFSKVDFKSIIEETVKIEKPQFMQKVKYKIDVQQFGQKVMQRAFDIEVV